jgi:hypothetical protein
MVGGEVGKFVGVDEGNVLLEGATLGSDDGRAVVGVIVGIDVVGEIDEVAVVGERVGALVGLLVCV